MGTVAFRTCAADVDNQTRTATDNICRAARSIAQSATDLESYVLKRFPLSPALEYTDWVGAVAGGTSHDSQDALMMRCAENADTEAALHLVSQDKATTFQASLAHSGSRIKANSHVIQSIRDSAMPNSRSKAVTLFPGSATYTASTQTWGAPFLKV